MEAAMRALPVHLISCRLPANTCSPGTGPPHRCLFHSFIRILPLKVAARRHGDILSPRLRFLTPGIPESNFSCAVRLDGVSTCRSLPAKSDWWLLPILLHA